MFDDVVVVDWCADEARKWSHALATANIGNKRQTRKSSDQSEKLFFDYEPLCMLKIKSCNY